MTQRTQDNTPRPTVEVDGLPLSEGFPIRRIVLKLLSGPDAGKEVESDAQSIRLGADPLCDIVLVDPTVSRNHAEVRQQGARLMLVDLGSTNGTFLSQKRVSESVELRSGQVFRVGRTRVRVSTTLERVEIQLPQTMRDENIVGQSLALREIFSILDRIAPSTLSVVIEGETGTGKELIARAIHDHSKRATKPFVVFDCSAFPATLLESELFGHEKGAFTGAVGRHSGVFERADGGTLFIDELGELDLEFQAKFLRVLETGQLRRVGGEHTISVDVRVVTATNRNLQEMVAARTFRQDLFYRLAQVRFLLPPLRKRVEDIPLLANHFLDKMAQKSGRRPGISQDALARMQKGTWPGNIRQLRNVMEKAVAMCTSGVISGQYIQQELDAQAASHAVMAGGVRPLEPFGVPSISMPEEMLSSATSYAHDVEMQGVQIRTQMLSDDGTVLPFKVVKDSIIAAFEVQYIETLLARSKTISEAARTAGVDRRHFYRLLNKHDMVDE